MGLEVEGRFLFYRGLGVRFRKTALPVNRFNLFVEDEKSIFGDRQIHRRAVEVLCGAVFLFFPRERYTLLVDAFCLKLEGDHKQRLLEFLERIGARHHIGKHLSFVVRAPEQLFEFLDVFCPYCSDIMMRVHEGSEASLSDEIESSMADPPEKREEAYVEQLGRYHAVVFVSVNPVFMGIVTRLNELSGFEKHLSSVAGERGFSTAPTGA
jgi:hypothetical protein